MKFGRPKSLRRPEADTTISKLGRVPSVIGGPDVTKESLAMQLQPINLVAVIAVIMGISVVLIPVIGLTARFALKPVVEALSRVFESRGSDEALQIVERRIALLETQIEGMHSSMKRIEETSRFDAQLRTGSEEPKDQLPAP